MSIEHRPRSDSWMDRSVSRRGFFRLTGRNAKDTLMILSGAAATGGLAYLILENFLESEGFENLTGQVIDGRVRPVKVDIIPETPLLRFKLDMSDETIIGTVKPGTIADEAVSVLGPLYPTGQSDLVVEVKDKKGRVRKYGVWFEISTPIQARKTDGTIVESTGYMAGNFITSPDKNP